MFKVLVLQECNGLSDDQIGFQLLEPLSFQRFIGQGLQEIVPDAKTIWLYRQLHTNAGVIDQLAEQLSKEMKKLGLVAKKCGMIDANFVKFPVLPNTKEPNDQKEAVTNRIGKRSSNGRMIHSNRPLKIIHRFTTPVHISSVI